VVAIGEAVGAWANELIESASEQIQTIINLIIVGGLTVGCVQRSIWIQFFKPATAIKGFLASNDPSSATEAGEVKRRGPGKLNRQLPFAAATG
jgi:hypothetical protein